MRIKIWVCPKCDERVFPYELVQGIYRCKVCNAEGQFVVLEFALP
jgi:hypothetical protein